MESFDGLQQPVKNFSPCVKPCRLLQGIGITPAGQRISLNSANYVSLATTP